MSKEENIINISTVLTSESQVISSSTKSQWALAFTSSTFLASFLSVHNPFAYETDVLLRDPWRGERLGCVVFFPNKNDKIMQFDRER
jgi:hypothetical protein